MRVIKIIEGGLIKIIDETHTVLPEGEVSVALLLLLHAIARNLIGCVPPNALCEFPFPRRS